MSHERPLVTPLLSHCPPTLPAATYRDADWFALEKRLIFGRNWLHVGREADFPPATLSRRRIADLNVVILRDAEGTLAAFHNICRHRGAELCNAERTDNRGALLRCPYHAWSYARDGRLVSTGFGTPGADFDRAAHGLLPVALVTWAGSVFVNADPEPRPFAPDLGLAALDHWPMYRLVRGHSLQRDIECNWKVFWENYNECLHCPGIHPSLSARVPVYARGVMSAPELPGWTAADPPAPVLAASALTWTVSGRPAGPVFADLTAAERAEGHRFVTSYPSCYIVAHVDYVRIVSLVPLAPDRTRLRADWLFLPETLAAPGFDLADVTGFAETVMEEDAAACEMNQRGIANPAYAGGTLMPQEFDVHAFHNWVRRELGDALPA